MRVIKTFGILLLVIIAIAMILMLVMPTSQQIERYITVNAPAEKVYEYLSKFENFNKWSAWNRHDSSLVNTITGTDGTLGAVNSWKGDPALSGQGQMKISSLEINQEIEHEIKFLAPREMNAKSEFDLQETNGQTKVTWKFELRTPRPWNIFNLMSSLDRKMGKDFEDGLRNMKADIEKGAPLSKPKKTYEVIPANYPATTFITIRQKVSWKDIPGFYSSNEPRIFEAIRQAGLSPFFPACLFYTWDVANQETNMAIGIPVVNTDGFKNDSFEVVQIPASKALYADYFGPYDQSMEAYAAIDKYLAMHGLEQKYPIIEQYYNTPQEKTDRSKWKTRIFYLVK
jgi:effector-binding domain-containing protein